LLIFNVELVIGYWSLVIGHWSLPARLARQRSGGVISHCLPDWRASGQAGSLVIVSFASRYWSLVIGFALLVIGCAVVLS
jgi:hypothetical protein